MTIIESYYNLLHKVINSDFKITLYTSLEDKKNLEIEQEIKSKLSGELANLKTQLSEKNDDAD